MPNLSLPRIKCPPKSINSLIRNIAKCVLAEVKRIDLELRKCEVGNNNFPNYRPSRLVDAKWRKSVVPKSTHPCSWSGLRLTETNLMARYAEKEGQTVQITGFPMHESYITFRNALYQGTSEPAMDKSPLLCEIFKKSLENNLAEVGRLQRFWIRFVNDVQKMIKEKKEERFSRSLTRHIETLNSPWRLK